MATDSTADSSNMKKPFYKKTWFIVIASLLVISVIFSRGEDTTTSESATGTSTSESSETSTSESNETSTSESTPDEVATEEPALEITAKKLVDDLEANALSAKTNYNGKVVKITGALSIIDASGKYFGLDPDADGFWLTSIQVYIDEDLIPTVSNLTKGQTVTVTGKITDVGELLGYSVDAISIP